jgi:hypothetical protein
MIFISFDLSQQAELNDGKIITLQLILEEL